MKTADIIAKFGPVGENQTYCVLPYEMCLAWDKKVKIHRFYCHKAIKVQLENIFAEVLAVYGIDKIRALGLDVFGGCFNVRKMRNGSRPSVHSWGLAVDLDPENNKLSWGKDKALFANPEYNKFWSIVEKHGGVSLGRKKNYDWMHFQFVPVED